MRFGFDAETLLEFVQKLFLLRIETIGIGEFDLGDQIPFAPAVYVADTLIAETVLLFVFGPGFKVEFEFAGQGRNRNRFTQYRLGKENRDFEVHIVAVTDEMGVFLDFERNVQIASYAAFPRISASRHP